MKTWLLVSLRYVLPSLLAAGGALIGVLIAPQPERLPFWQVTAASEATRSHEIVPARKQNADRRRYQICKTGGDGVVIVIVDVGFNATDISEIANSEGCQNVWTDRGLILKLKSGSTARGYYKQL